MAEETGYEFWLAALRGEKPAVHGNDPRPGYYRTKEGQPVAIWRNDEGQIVGTINGAWVDIAQKWTWVCQRPVTEQAYEDAMDGKPWPDVDQAVHDARHGIGGNAPEDRDVLVDQIESALAGIAAYGDIKDDDTAAKAQSLRSRLNELAGDAEDRRVKEKEPHLQAGKAVDTKWQPIVKRAKAGADTLKAAMGKWETAKFQAELKRLNELAAARKAAEDAGKPPPAPVQPQTPAPVSQIRGGAGRAAAVRTVRVIKEVTDYLALLTHYGPRQEVQDAVLALARKDVASGLTPPGVEITEERAIR